MAIKDPDWLRYRRRQKRSYLGTIGGGAIGGGTLGVATHYGTKKYIRHIEKTANFKPDGNGFYKYQRAKSLYKLGRKPYMSIAGAIGGAIIGNRLLRNRKRK